MGAGRVDGGCAMCRSWPGRVGGLWSRRGYGDDGCGRGRDNGRGLGRHRRWAWLSVPPAEATATTLSVPASVPIAGVNGRWPRSGACVSHEIGPITNRMRPSETFKTLGRPEIELRSGAACDLLAPFGARARRFVRAGQRDHVEDVGDGDDPRRRGISSALSPRRYPVQSHRSWWAPTAARQSASHSRSGAVSSSP